jgi:hypothetical protein
MKSLSPGIRFAADVVLAAAAFGGFFWLLVG